MRRIGGKIMEGKRREKEEVEEQEDYANKGGRRLGRSLKRIAKTVFNWGKTAED